MPGHIHDSQSGTEVVCLSCCLEQWKQWCCSTAQLHHKCWVAVPGWVFGARISKMGPEGVTLLLGHRKQKWNRRFERCHIHTLCRNLRGRRFSLLFEIRPPRGRPCCPGNTGRATLVESAALKALFDPTVSVANISRAVSATIISCLLPPVTQTGLRLLVKLQPGSHFNFCELTRLTKLACC